MEARAEIITIGDEILFGQTLDTNSHWMSQELSISGIRVIRKTTIGDKKEVILKSLKEAESRADIILITGGLGPTSDDLTKPCLVEYFKTKLVPHEETLNNIKELFEKAGREMTTQNIKQAELPASCTVIPNKLGTAAGMWFEKDEKVFISMPGVPYEMKGMMQLHILPKLQSQFVEYQIFHKMIRTVGIPESKLADLILDWESDLPESIKLAYLPTLGTVKLRLTSTGNDLDKLKKETDKEVKKLLPIISKYVYGFDDEELEEAIGRLLLNSNKTLAIAESCTGGYLSHKITSVPGSSQWFNGSMITYNNQVKSNNLGVNESTIVKHGAVSEEVVLEMAENVRKRLNSDIGVSVSGIAGPSGGTPDKPVGTVWIGYSDDQKTVAKKVQFTKDRQLNIQFSATAALNMIRLNLESE